MQRDFIYNGGLSTRYHTADVLNRQNIAEHSFGVAWFCEMITEGRASKNLIMAALAHDLAEHMVGDIPSPAKRALGLSAQFDEYEERYLDQGGVSKYGNSLDYEETAVLKLADMMDGMMFCLRERSLGNRKVEVIFKNFTSYTDTLLMKNPALTCLTEAHRLRDDIVQEWEALTNDRINHTGSDSERHSNCGVSLSSRVPALGLDGGRKSSVPPVGVDKVSDKVEKEKRHPRP